MASETCLDCKFFRPVALATEFASWGECHFSAPQPAGSAQPPLHLWPRVANTDWCGQWSA